MANILNLSGFRQPSQQAPAGRVAGNNAPFVGTPTASSSPPPRATTAGQQPNNAGTMAALGISPEEAAKRQQQTGVNPGGTGYVSGQANPATNNAMSALGGGFLPSRTTASAPTAAPATAPTGTAPGAGGVFAVAPTPVSTPPPVSRGFGPSAAPVTTQTGALSSTGTTEGPRAISTGNATADKILDPGNIFGGATQVDLAPAQAAQRAGYNLSDQFGNERYNYRPGEAPSQDRVQLDTANSDQIRARQLGSLDALTAAANGTVPSAAEIQLEQQAAKNNAANLGAARALGGRSAGGAARNATVANAEANNATNVAAAAQRAVEQANARNALSGALTGVRGQDVDVSQANANLGQAANANNLQAQTQTNQLAEQHRQNLINAQLSALNIGTTGGTAGLTAAAKNADAANKQKAGILGTASDVLAAL